MGFGDERRRARSPVSVTELRKQYGTNLPPSLRWGRDQNARRVSPVRRRISRSPSPYFLPRTSEKRRFSPGPPPPPPPALLHRRIHVDSVLVDSLTYFGLLWEYDKDDSDYIIILRDLPLWEEDRLFDHTAQLRNGTWNEFDPANEGWKKFPRRFSRTVIVSDSEESEAEPDNESAIEEASAKSDARTFPTTTKLGTNADSTASSPKSVIIQSAESFPFQSVFHASYGEDTQKWWKSTSANRQLRREAVKAFPQSGRPSKEALFHVLHVQQDILNFDKFLEAMLAIPQLGEVKDKIEEHFVHCWSPIVSSPWKGRNRSCKHTSTVDIDEVHETEDGKERFIPGRNWYAANDSEVHYTRDGDFHVLSIGVPFAHLGKLDDNERDSRALSESDVPTHTLFQSLNRNLNAKLDLKQVVCRMKSGERQDGQLVSSLWAVIINDELLITCSPLSQEETYGSLLTISPSSVDLVTGDGGLADIRVRAIDNSLWLLKREECRTYLDFVAQFSNITRCFASEITIQYNGHDIPPMSWATFILENSDPVLNLTLKNSKKMMTHKSHEDLRTTIGLKNFPRSRAQHQNSEPSMDSLTSAELLKLSKDTLTIPAKEALDKSPPAETTGPHLVDPTDRVMSFDLLDSDVENDNTIVLDTDQIYEECAEVAPSVFNDQLESSCSANLRVLETGTDEHALLSQEMINTLSHVLSFAYPFAPKRDGSMVADILHGLRGLSKLFPMSCQRDLQTPRDKLLGASFKFISALHSTIVPAPTMAAVLFLQNCYEKNGHLRDLFLLANELESYPFNFTTSLDRKSATSSKYPMKFARHVVAALVIAASLAEKLLELRVEDFEKELVRHPSTKIPGFGIDITLALVSASVHPMTPERITETDLLKASKQACSKLEHIGLSENTMLRILQLKHGWKRVAWHADEATFILRQAFNHALDHHPGEKIICKAAVLPPDLLVGLLQGLIHLPTIHDQDALFMYNRYMTELESDILTANFTLEPLARLRNLTHELNAFLQLQHKQLNVLQGLSRSLEEREDNIAASGRAPFLFRHPREDCLSDSTNKLKLQIDNVEALRGLIDKYQRYA